MNLTNQSHRIEEINNLIIELASGNLEASGNVSPQHDEFDAIITGINMLGEELRDSTVSRDYLKSIFQGVVDMLIVLNTDNIIIEVNESLCRILNYDSSELIGKHLSTLLVNKKDKLVKITNTLNKKGYCHNVEKNFITKNNQVIPVSCSVSLLYDNSKSKQGILYIAKDISKIKKTEDDLRNKNLEMDTFIYKAAHDLKGPVASILGITNFAPIDVKDPTAVKYFNMIHDCCEKLDKVLVNLREIAAINKAKKDRTLINLKELIDNILFGFKNQFQKCGFKIISDIPSNIDFMINENMISIVLHNIIDNSLKFKTDNNPVIILSAKENKDMIAISIKDNGIGIKKALQPKVFNMFYRAHNSKDGSGLGLYIVKTFITAIGGSVSLKSFENKGTVITIEVPNVKM